jgi:excisionase family DNA binding protein
VPIQHVQRILRHANVRTTVDTYGHLANEDLRAPLEPLPALPKRALPPPAEARHVPSVCQPIAERKHEGPDQKISPLNPALKLERNTGFEPATFALATRQSAIHEASGAYTNLHDPAISFGSQEPDAPPGSTNLHADSLASCAQHVPRVHQPDSGPSLDVSQVAALLDCSSAHIYKLCERGELPHYRTFANAVRFACGVLGKTLRPRRTLA